MAMEDQGGMDGTGSNESKDGGDNRDHAQSAEREDPGAGHLEPAQSAQPGAQQPAQAQTRHPAEQADASAGQPEAAHKTTDGGATRPAANEPFVVAAARKYTRRGWRVVPLKPRDKRPAVGPGWQHLRLREEELLAAFDAHSNIGVLTGRASCGLVDVDCDVVEAVVAAAALLPQTGLLHGRQGKLACHYWYQLIPEPGAPQHVPSLTFAFRPAQPPVQAALPQGQAAEAPASAEASPGEHTEHTQTLVELRGDGHQTMAPPSVHPDGEQLRWHRRYAGAPATPGEVSYTTLARLVARVAACALLARHWPGKGLRDETALALCGLLLRGGWPADQVDVFVRLVAEVAGDEEWRQRGKGTRTAKRLAEGDTVFGGTALAERLGPDGPRVVSHVCQWLGLGQGMAASARGDPSYAYAPISAVPGGRLIPPASSEPGRDAGDAAEGAGPSGAPGGTGATAAAHASSQTPSGPGVLLSEVREQPLRWLWPGRLALGKLALLDGDPGLGKSLLTCDLAARLTSGRPMPDGAPSGVPGGEPAGVVLLSAEDGLADTIRPRLRVAGADLARVVALRGVPTFNGDTGQVYERAIMLPGDLPMLTAAAQRVGARLLVIDPLMAYLDPRVNSWRDQDARAVLAPLARLAEDLELAVLILRHLNKTGGTNALYRGGGSIGLIGAARCGLLVAADPDDPEHSRVLASTKSNLGPPAASLRYRIAPAASSAPAAEGDGINIIDFPRMEWLGACGYSAAALLAASSGGGNGDSKPQLLEEAMEWLREALGEGPHDAEDVKRAALAAGHSERTLRRARERLGVRSVRAGFGPGSTMRWELPSEQPCVANVEVGQVCVSPGAERPAP